ncbi:HelD family protein [Enterococcus wangshanyuanii]|uniref:DNA helicase n=1 Tax=Enterococcus wangshanyuanii TaxID=2005703 RepID=A0ABQ1NKE0_9ENTE|nr:UvrD-helicase domain-containing protein [Enterococcus wangshanyuanii]GGC79480.1 DNA helicase [Enterococcus wangshanyuanii]
MSITKENTYLTEVTEKIKAKMKQIDGTVDANEQAYKNLKKYTVDYKNELDKYEVYNHQQNLSFIDNRNSFETSIRKKLAYLKETPYFSRIDFQFDNEDEIEKFYIGRYGFADDLGQQLIYDWRAPISSLYYDFSLGDAYYESLGMKFHGYVKGKRQFEIEKGKLKFVVDTDDTVNDDFLMNELSKNTSNEMKTIIHTIQKEQNEAIRDVKTKNLIIQGVAGSGKTSIALHRIAYLLYQKRDELQASDILILSPNDVFSSYISTVLPELGEDELNQLEITQLVQPMIDEKLTVTDRQDEINRIVEKPKSKEAQTYLYKRSEIFFLSLKNHIQQLSNRLFFEDIVVDHQYTFSKKDLEKANNTLTESALFPKTKQLARQLSKNVSEIEQSHVREAIEKELRDRLQVTTSWTEYVNFLTAERISFNQHKNKIDYADLFPYLYLKMNIEGILPNHQIKHLVIDEMQDYSPLHFYVLDRLFPCQKTICGDVNHDLLTTEINFLEQLQTVIPNNRVIKFNTSYRSSYEIIEFAKRFTTNKALTPIERHNKEVQLIYVDHLREKQEQLTKIVESFETSAHRTCGIICQTWDEVAKIEKSLSSYEVTRFGKQSTAMTEGIIITTSQFAKGLEFDQVILTDIRKEQLEAKSNLLYTSCSRALHELTLFISNDGGKTDGNI